LTFADTGTIENRALDFFKIYNNENNFFNSPALLPFLLLLAVPRIRKKRSLPNMDERFSDIGYKC